MKRIGNDHSFLRRLRRDARGNTIALVAAALIPLTGMIGGAVDMSRLYLTKTRLQQACDAGVLTGRKVMATGAWTTGTNNGSAEAKAKEMFNANFAEGAYGTGALLKDFREADGTVTGTASVAVPMTLMRIFGMTQRNLEVSCTAKMEIPNTDVMFVLDVTGSMAGTRIAGLKSAVKCFYEALLRVNTSQVCGNDPSSESYAGTAQIRIGFVPYSVNVNVGKLLPHAYLADNWDYQTRQGVYYSPGASTTTSPVPDPSPPTKKSECVNGTVASGPPDTTTPSSFTLEEKIYTNASWNNPSSKCTRTVSVRTTVHTRNDASGTYLHTWIYKQIKLNVSGLKGGGTNWNNTVSLRVGNGGTWSNVAWDGCIEERQTVKTNSKNPLGEWTPIPAAAYDLDIDMIPDAGKAGSQWGPILNNAVWGRYTGTNTGNRTVSDVMTSTDLSRNTSYSCSTEAKKLQTWYTPGGFESYVNSLNAAGNTYHDIGMIWGARFISPTGIFSSENKETATGGAIQRHIIFMTDGDTNTVVKDSSNRGDLSAYGASWWDRRQTTYEPTNNDVGNILNVRLAALCTAIKNRNIALWVVSYGGDASAETEARLKTCATPGKYFSAADSTALIANFKQIAAEIAELRLIN